jgi:hypothetical protein
VKTIILKVTVTKDIFEKAKILLTGKIKVSVIDTALAEVLTLRIPTSAFGSEKLILTIPATAVLRNFRQEVLTPKFHTDRLYEQIKKNSPINSYTILPKDSRY